MSVDEQLSTQARGLSESAWALSASGIGTVYRLELRQRLRSRWWAIVIAIFFVLLLVLTALIFNVATDSESLGSDSSERAGATMFGVVAILVLSLAALISPALSAGSINGDRNQGVLAVLQSTLITPAELVIGKLLAAWTSSLILIGTSLPFLIWAYLLGGTTGRRLITTIVVIALTLLVVCAIGLGCSSFIARTGASSATTYLLVTLLGLGLPLFFGLTIGLVTYDSTELRPVVTYQGVDANGQDHTSCEMRQTTETRVHTEYTWWLLAASPYVVTADSSPAKANLRGQDVLDEIRSGVRSARLGEKSLEPRTCAEAQNSDSFSDQQRVQEDDLPAAWPWGLGIDLLIGALFVAGAVRRVRIPAKKLPRGTRVA